MEQLFALALADPVFQSTQISKKDNLRWQGLLQATSVFDVKGLPQGDQSNYTYLSEEAILSNMISRGLPTKTSLKVEEALAKAFGLTEPVTGQNLGNIQYQFKNKQNYHDQLFEAFHLIDPRLKLNPANYNLQTTESSFEKEFLFNLVDADHAYIRQLLEPQCPLDQIVTADEQQSFQRRRTDFATHSPYLQNLTVEDQYGGPKTSGFAIEVDGLHHQNEIVYDEKRDQAIKANGWQPFRIKSQSKQPDTDHLINALEQDAFIQQCRENAEKSLSGEWLNILQLVLTPIAIARLQKVLLTYALQKQTSVENLHVAIIEQDVPCGELAVNDLMDWLGNLKALAGKDTANPGLDCDVFSTPEFFDSPLHELSGHGKVFPIEYFPADNHDYDLVLDISMLRRSKIEKPLSTQNLIQIRSAHFQKRYAYNHFYSAPALTYRPVCQQAQNEVYTKIPETSDNLRFFLRNIFRKKNFREGQLPILNKALQNESVVGLLPTGGGKSLAYQLASLLQPGFTIVVDPIKSLMQDQYDNLCKMGIDAALFINSSLNTSERKEATARFQRGQALFCFISPERMVIEEFRDTLTEMGQEGLYFTYFVIDEVHCVSEWGHDFRTPYLNLAKNAVKYCQTFSGNPVPIFGLTATASFDVLSDVERELSSGQPIGLDAIIRFENTIRNELQYKVIPVDANIDDKADLNLDGIENLPSRLVKLDKKNKAKDLSDLDLKGEIGKAKQDALNELLFDGQLLKDFKHFNQEATIEDIASRAFDEFLEQKDQEKLYQEWGYQSRFNDKDLVELPTQEQNEILNAIKARYLKDHVATIPLNLDNQFFDSECKNAGIIFCPHRSWYHGVSDKGKTDYNGELLPPEKHNGIADNLDSTAIKVGTFVGSGGSEAIQDHSANNQQLFVNSELHLMVATKAFGMGVDKSNIRFTVHFNMPSSIEGFVQEGGRAGRDQQLAINYIFLNQQKFACWDDHARMALLKALHKEGKGEDKATLASVKKWLSDGIKGKMLRRGDFDQLIDSIGATDPNFPAETIKITTPTLQVDKDNLIFFHNNAFKGEDKELAVLNELLTEITYPHFQNAKLLSETISELIGYEVLLKFSSGDYKDYLWVNSSDGSAIGFFKTHQDFSIRAYNNAFSEKQAIQVMNAIYDKLFSLKALQNKTHQQAKNYLQQSSEGSINGIGKWLEKTDVKEGDKKEFEVFFKNLYATDKNTYIKKLKYAISAKWGTNSIPKNLDQYLSDDLEDFLIWLKYKTKIDFEQILKDEESWRLLSIAFYAEREKEDTDKAIYRLHSIGIVEDYTIDYRQGKYLVKVKKLSKAQYFDHYRSFLTRYYSERKAEQEIHKLHEAYSNLSLKAFLNELLKHLVYLIYQEIANKRLRAIDDMMTACETGINEGNHSMKQFIYLYFNSKYARIGYQIDGKDYNLVSENHTSNGKEQSLEIVWKFIEAIAIDPTGSQQDNLKHLRGACMRILRANPENASAQLLKSFSLLILAERNKNLLREAEGDFLAGFQNFQNHYQQWSFNQFYQEAILRFQEKVRENTNDQEVLIKLEKMVEYLYLNKHNEWLKSFKPQFLANYG